MAIAQPHALVSSFCSAAPGYISNSSFAPYKSSLVKLTLMSSSGTEERLNLSSSTTTSPFKARRSSIMRLPSAIDLISLQMPSLSCTFPALVHADYEVVKERCDAWIEALAEPPSASASRFLHDCLLPLLVCQFIPKTVSEQRLVHVIKAIAWLMIADDDDDHPDVLGSDYATTSHRANLVMAILRKEDGVNESSFDCSFLANTRPGFATKCARMLKSLSELWDEIRKEMPPSVQARFISTMADYFEGIKVQASFRAQVTIPDMESYMEIRRQASFTIPCFILMEYALGIELDEPTFYNPLIQELRNVALDYISLCNDIVSSPIEIGIGDYFNLPSILYSSAVSPSNFTSFQNAMDHVAQMAEDLNNRAISLISTIHDDNKHIEPYMVAPIHAYVEALSLGMSGALAWFYKTARYQEAHGRSDLHQLANQGMPH
uniref:Terpene synthase n=1 Tax=Thelypteris parasitica TaxID=714463 RepID=A0A7M3UPY6_9MONI|nr:MTPSL [Christella parasitica]